MTHRPETRARAVLALVVPLLDRLDRGTAYGDIDLTGTRELLSAHVSRVRAVAVLGQHPDLKPVKWESDADVRHAAIDAFLGAARSAGVRGISPEQVEAKTNEIAAKEDARLADATRFMCELLESLPRRRVHRKIVTVKRVQPPDGAAAEPLDPDQARALTDRVMREAAE